MKVSISHIEYFLFEFYSYPFIYQKFAVIKAFSHHAFAPRFRGAHTNYNLLNLPACNIFEYPLLKSAYIVFDYFAV